MVAHILQIAYYTTLRETRARMLQAAGYRVTSVVGNDEAMRLDKAAIASVDLVVIGFCALQTVRTTMVQWLKARYPNIVVVVLQFHNWEKFPEADAATLSDDPTVWLATIATLLKA
jgi:DNA-binding NtrC family response regulator